MVEFPWLIKLIPLWVKVVLLMRLALSLMPARATLALTLTVNADTGTVNPGDPCPVPRNGAVYKTIQKAVNCAQAGDTINVAAGTYIENVNIDKSLSLLGANAGIDARMLRGAETVVDGNLTSAPFAINANNVTIDGFKIMRGQNGLGTGVWMGNLSGIQVLNNIITDNTLTVISPMIDLSLTKTDDGLIAAPGDVISYSLTYTNTGNSIVTGLVVTETVPANTTFNAAASLPTVWSCPNGNPGATLCTSSLSNAPGGGSTGVFTFAVTIAMLAPTGSPTVTITNTARIDDDGSHGPDPAANNLAIDTTLVTVPINGSTATFLTMILKG